jgi:hypothetical protein
MVGFELIEDLELILPITRWTFDQAQITQRSLNTGNRMWKCIFVEIKSKK